jgi:hypothetical protein
MNMAASIKAKSFEPIKILGVITDKVGTPRDDGTPGSGLYEVPFRLSSRPLSPWTEFFVDAWNRPSRFTSMHRPGIARVEGDRIVLDGTTIEEVEKYHLDTLKLAVNRANELTQEWFRRRDEAAGSAASTQEKHRRHVDEIAKRLKFE